MPNERKIIRILIQHLIDYEIEIKALGLTLAAMRTMHPDFPALAVLSQARLDQEFHTVVQARYQRILEGLDSADLRDLATMIPPSKWEN